MTYHLHVGFTRASGVDKTKFTLFLCSKIPNLINIFTTMTIHSNIFPSLRLNSNIQSPLWVINNTKRVFVDNHSVREINTRRRKTIGLIKQLKKNLLGSVTILFGMCSGKSYHINAFNGTSLSRNPTMKTTVLSPAINFTGYFFYHIKHNL